ncbi:HTH-type transcriptional repressor FabR [Aliidiomarina halalkaliphila]|uniref:HTH-type transcriptional repressor FabR n=1 Tax=Aliidiomarina halalkaliphila TaxID=2593535 RepID=A0A552X1U6_9GAMM|nr:HTH-type transcriptional repressor FabR [Aliidiomarina halalkaliphila]TRW49020.1 HTH-type transcriptional repressor FabR [Aliidiomarina halalkaliphila]
MVGIRAKQKEKTRRALINAALNQLSPQTTFSSLSLREVAREAHIAPTSFYRHFQNMDELGLTLVDEAGLTLRQLLRQSRQRLADGGSVIRISVEIFMDFISQNSSVFRLLLQERSGTSKEFRMAIAREIEHFKSELTDYLYADRELPEWLAKIQADAMVRVVFSAGADALDLPAAERTAIAEQTIIQLRMIARGSDTMKQEDPKRAAEPKKP